MSTSTSATTQEQESGSSPQLPSGKTADSGKADKKKLKLLKQALKDERAAKTSIEKELESAVQQIDQLKKVCSEKVSWLRS